MAKTEVAPNELVYIKGEHSGDHAPAVTTLEAFNDLWKAKKWYLADANGDKVTTPAKALVTNPDTAEAATTGGVS